MLNAARLAQSMQQDLPGMQHVSHMYATVAGQLCYSDFGSGGAQGDVTSALSCPS